MKKIEAIISPSTLDSVRDALEKMGVEELTVSEVKSFNRRNSQTRVYRGVRFTVDAVPQIKIETVLADHQADAVVSLLVRESKAGKVNRARVIVTTLADSALAVATPAELGILQH